MQDDEAARVATIVERLHRAYPDATCSLHFSTPLELLVATILSAQCTDERVNAVTARLFKTYRSAEDYGVEEGVTGRVDLGDECMRVERRTRTKRARNIRKIARIRHACQIQIAVRVESTAGTTTAWSRVWSWTRTWRG